MGLAIDSNDIFYLTEYKSNSRLFTVDPVSGSTNFISNISIVAVPHGGEFAPGGIKASDNSGSYSIEQTSGLPSGSIFPIGTTTNTFKVTDPQGNSTSCSFTVTVEDTMDPVVVTKNITVQLDENGTVPITPADINDGSTDNCDIDTYSLDIDSFTCADVDSPVTVTLTVKDVNGNSASETATVTVEDNLAPVVITKDITVQLDESGEASIVPSDINDNSTDNCEIDTYILDIDSFTCADVNAPVTVTLTVNDVNGNSASETATVTVEDNVAPVVITKDITVELDENGEASIVPSDINDGSTDNCGIDTYSLDIDSFTCADVDSPVTVTLTVEDVNGNSASETAVVTVEDNVAPVVTTKDITVQLDAEGNATITPQMMDNGSYDACGIASMHVSPDTFVSSEIGDNTVTFTVVDNNGLESTTTAIVTVQDNISPVVLTKDITVQLDANGAATISPADLNNGTTDNVGIKNMTVDVDSFSCEDIGTESKGYSFKGYTSYDEAESGATAAKLIKMSNGNILAVYRTNRANKHIGNDGYIAGRISTDNGENFGNQFIIYSDQYDDRNCIVGTTPNGTTVIVFRRYDADTNSNIDADI